MLKEIIKAIGEPKTINKNSFGGYVAIWNITKQQTLNRFKKAGFKVNKLYSPYYMVLFDVGGIAHRLDIANRQGEYFKQSIGTDDLKGFEYLFNKIIRIEAIK